MKETLRSTTTPQCFLFPDCKKPPHFEQRKVRNKLKPGILTFAPGNVATVYFYITVQNSATSKAPWQNVAASLKNKTLVLPADLRAIGDYAFEGADCEIVMIPDQCGYIGHGAFKNCKNLVFVKGVRTKSWTKGPSLSMNPRV